MDGKNTFNESQFNMSAQLAQRLYSKYSDTGQIIPNRTQNIKKLKAKRLPNSKLPEISKQSRVTQPPFPPIHYPKGFERFSGLDKLHLTQPIRFGPGEESKLPTLSKVPSQVALRQSRSNIKLMQTLSPLSGGPLLKYPLNITKPFNLEEGETLLSKTHLGDGLKPLALLKKEQDKALRTISDTHRRSVTQLKPLESSK
jgi:hypothetical protein